jgi:hypothetical protein
MISESRGPGHLRGLNDHRAIRHHNASHFPIRSLNDSLLNTSFAVLRRQQLQVKPTRR